MARRSSSSAAALALLCCVCAAALVATAAASHHTPQGASRDALRRQDKERDRAARHQHEADKDLAETKAKLLARARRLGICLSSNGTLTECGKEGGSTKASVA